GLAKMGAQISVEGSVATVRGVDMLYGSEVIAADLRASCSFLLAGLVAEGETRIAGIHHLLRGYDGLDSKLCALGAQVQLMSDMPIADSSQQKAQISLL
ncbi:UDP-N-acetylglucosamine 1-carboxyvinyltransferase, partial [bacterium]|nr:UDP-N-acetylglucosamine 1-carboxyvinyltransferase [bacterium]